MLKRTISGACYVAIIVSFFLLRNYVHNSIFNILLWFFCAVGTFEIARATKNFTNKFTFVLQVVYGILFMPVYYLAETFIKSGWGIILAVDLTVLAMLVLAIYYIFANQTTKQYFISILSTSIFSP